MRRALGRDYRAAYAFMLPTVLLMGGLIAYPFLRAVYISFTHTRGADHRPLGRPGELPRSVGGSLFPRRGRHHPALHRLVGGVALAIAMVAALLLHRLGRPAPLLAGLLLLPWIMPEIVRAITWRGLLDPLYGGVNPAARPGAHQNAGSPSSATWTALPSVILVNVWQRRALLRHQSLAGLKAADPELYEAAAIDGASPWRQFLHVTLPALRYVLLVVALLGAIWSLNEFNLVYLLTGGGPANATKLYSVLAYNYGVAGLAGVAGGDLHGAGLSDAPAGGRYMVRAQRRVGAARRTPGERARLAAAALPSAGRRLFWLANDAAERLAATRALPRGAQRPGQALSARRAGAVVAALLLGLLVFVLAPFYWVFVTAFKTELQITRFESVLWPRPWSLEQFRRLLAPHLSFRLWLQNTLLLASGDASCLDVLGLPVPTPSPACAGAAPSSWPAVSWSPTSCPPP